MNTKATDGKWLKKKTKQKARQKKKHDNNDFKFAIHVLQT